MSEFERICSVSDVPGEGYVGEFSIKGRPLCVAHVNGAIVVLDGVCPHEGGPLGEGIVEDGRVVCPWHQYAFDPRSGVSDQDPVVKVEVFHSKIEAGELMVKI
jgi:nitrite reductase (NADH) small subunit